MIDNDDAMNEIFESTHAITESSYVNYKHASYSLKQEEWRYFRIEKDERENYFEALF